MATEAEWSTIFHFRPDEFVHPESISYQLLIRLDTARSLAGIPFVITSSIRSWPPTSSHRKGLAADISTPDGVTCFKVVQALLRAGFQRIIVYSRHVHADVDESKPSPLLLVGGFSK